MFRLLLRRLNDDLKDIGSISIRDDEINLSLKSGGSEMRHARNVCALGVVQTTELAPGTLTKGIVGALLLGPAGLVAGAALGRVMRECIFIMKFSDEPQVICKGTVKDLESLQGYMKIRGFDVNEI